jgi:hypothetical protein
MAMSGHEHTRAHIHIRIHPGLLRATKARGEEHDLGVPQMIEWALANLLDIPPYVEGAGQPLSLCPDCEHALIVNNNCPNCDWHAIGKRDTLAYNKGTRRRFYDLTDKHGPVPDHAPDLDHCWTWNGPTDHQDRPIYMVTTRFRLARTLAWEDTHGPLPNARQLMTMCGTPTCIRPSHHTPVRVTWHDYKPVTASARALNPDPQHPNHTQ